MVVAGFARRAALFLSACACMMCGLSPARAQHGDPSRREPGPGRGIRPPGSFEEEKEKARVRIGMTKEQQAQIEAVYAESARKRADAMKELGEKHRQLRGVYDAYEVDKKQEREVLRDIVAIHWRLLRIHSEDEVKIRRILTKEQHEKLRTLMKEAMEQARKRWRGPGTRPPQSGAPKASR